MGESARASGGVEFVELGSIGVSPRGLVAWSSPMTSLAYTAGPAGFATAFFLLLRDVLAGCVLPVVVRRLVVVELFAELDFFRRAVEADAAAVRVGGWRLGLPESAGDVMSVPGMQD